MNQRIKPGIVLLTILLIGSFTSCLNTAKDRNKVEDSLFTLIHDPIAEITDTGSSVWTLQWTANKNYEAPVELDICLNHYQMKWHRFESSDGKSELIWDIIRDKRSSRERKRSGETSIAKFKVQKAIEAGEKFQFAITATGVSVSGVSVELMMRVNKDVNDMHGPVLLTMHPGQASSLNVISRAALQNDGTVRVMLVPVDDLGYPSIFPKAMPVTISEGENQLWKGKVKDTKELYLNISNKDVVRLTADTKIDGNSFSILSNPIWPNGNKDQIATFGDLHWHTNLSGDGTRSLEEGLSSGRDYINLDFVSPTEHAPEPDVWAEYVNTCDSFNEPDHYTALYGWERSSAHGHVNFYFVNADHEMNPDNFTYPKEPAKYIEDIPYKDFVAIPHHTNSRGKLRNGRYGFSPYPWGEPRDEYLRLIEIFQVRGNYEREDSPKGWMTDGKNNGGSAQAALAKGHKIGFIGSTDNHKGWPTIAVAKSRIYAGIWTKRRSRQDIYDGLYARHTWACWNTRAIVKFEVGSAMQGDELKLDKPQSLKARIKMSLEAPLDRLHIVSQDDQTIVIDVSDESLDIDQEVDLGMVEENTFFYLRARQNDKALIYASPVFITFK